MTVARYETWRPRARARALVQALEEACRRADAGGVRLTLSQAYYQLVLAGALANTAQARKQLGTVAARARMAGYLDWDLLTDGTSTYHPPIDVQQPNPAAGEAGDTGMKGSGAMREVWVEKNGLAGLVAQAAAEAGVGWASCDGLPSLGHLHRAALRFAAAIQAGRPVIVLYLGDLDPHGAVVERELRTQLTTMVAAHHLSRHQDLAGTRTRGAVLSRVLDHMRNHLDGAPPLTFHRVGLTRAQAEELQLPGDGAGGWEIEAADPLWLRSRLTRALDDAAESAQPSRGPDLHTNAETSLATSTNKEGIPR